MRSIQLASSSSAPVAKIHRHIAPSDDKARFFIDWWLRMHQAAGPLVAIALKPFSWSDEEAAPQRLMWEVCRWPQGLSSEWTFVCWMVDGVGMWMKRFATKRAAIAYFHQPPEVVMARSTDAKQPSDQAEPLAAAS